MSYFLSEQKRLLSLLKVEALDLIKTIEEVTVNPKLYERVSLPIYGMIEIRDILIKLGGSQNDQ